MLVQACGCTAPRVARLRKGAKQARRRIRDIRAGAMRFFAIPEWLDELQYRNALSHVMEMVLIHKEVNGNTWANVILPFQVSTSGTEVDIINPMIDLTKLPSRVWQSGYVMASATNYMGLEPGLKDAEFSAFWGTAPAAGCPSKTVNVRYLMRTTTVATDIKHLCV